MEAAPEIRIPLLQFDVLVLYILYHISHLASYSPATLRKISRYESDFQEVPDPNYISFQSANSIDESPSISDNPLSLPSAIL